MSFPLTTVAPLRGRVPTVAVIPAAKLVPRMLIVVATPAQMLGGLIPLIVGSAGAGEGLGAAPLTVRVSAVLPWLGPLLHWSVPVIENWYVPGRVRRLVFRVAVAELAKPVGAPPPEGVT
jgi:hypothetical protein